MSLADYHDRRDFRTTPEPRGDAGAETGGALRFVIHKHQASHLHYDLRLELEGVLKSWAVPKGPSTDPAEKRLAVRVEDHPLDYRSFEGVIPEGGYGAGTVMIWDEGTYTVPEAPAPAESAAWMARGLEKGAVHFVLEGKKLRGGFALAKLKKGDAKSWLLIKRNDDFASSRDIREDDLSASTGRSMDEIGRDGSRRCDDDSSLRALLDAGGAPRAEMPRGISPMTARQAAEPFDDAAWIFEIKWDGYRALAEIDCGEVALYSRNGLSFRERFHPVAAELEKIRTRAILDGEIVVLDDSGRPSFPLLQSYGQRGELVYYVFDILYLHDRDLTGLPLRRRKEIARALLPPGTSVRFCDHVEERGVDFFAQARAMGLEGIMAKRAESRYHAAARSGDWLKIKGAGRQEAVIAGFTEPRGSRRGLGALVLGVYEDGRLVYVGRASGRLSDADLVALRGELDGLSVSEPPLAGAPAGGAHVHWVAPKKVCEVSFLEWTPDGLMRHPVFLAMRDDVAPEDVRRKAPRRKPRDYAKPSGQATREVGPVTLTIVNPDKVFWPAEGYRKIDLVDYYREAAAFMLPHLVDRPESMHRYPDGIEGEGFYQKNLDIPLPGWVRTWKSRPESKQGREINYLLCQDEATLVYMANLGCIDVHPFMSRVQSLEYPDYAVLDIDPEEGVDFGTVIEVALAVKEALDMAGAPGFCKTSGALGLHVYVPLGARYTYGQSKQFAHLIAGLAHRLLPGLTSLERKVSKREKRVYLDYLQNNRSQTVAAPYSVRPRAGAPVSTPLEWSELRAGLHPLDFTMKNVLPRLGRRGDLFRPVLGPGIDMERCLEALAARGAAVA